MRVLIAAGDPSTLQLVESTLVRRGVDVVTARCDKEALEWIRAPDAPGMLIAEASLPGMDGVALCEALRRAGEAGRVYFILLGADSAARPLDEVFAAGVDDHIGLPLDPAELVGRVEAGRRRIEGQRSYEEQIDRANRLLDVKTAEFEQVVTDLQEVTDTFQGLFRNAQVGLLRTRISDGRALEANQRLVQIFGYESRKQCIDEYFARERYVDPSVREQLLAKLGGRGFVDNFVTRGRRRDGSEFWARFSACTYPGKDIIDSVILDVTEELEALERLWQREEDLRQTVQDLNRLSAGLQDEIERERTTIAREIHDELGQVLSAAKIGLETIKQEIEPASAGERLDAVVALIVRGIVAVRRIADELRPNLLDDLGLWAAIDWLVEEFQGVTGISCSLDLTDHIVDPERAIVLFRAVQEALNNVARHAQATQVTITSRFAARSLSLVIKDNGRGFVTAGGLPTTGLGLIGMRERIQHIDGAITINGSVGQGTTIEITVPVSPLEAARG